jgi:hypothetical protein
MPCWRANTRHAWQGWVPTHKDRTGNTYPSGGPRWVAGVLSALKRVQLTVSRTIEGSLPCMMGWIVSLRGLTEERDGCCASFLWNMFELLGGTVDARATHATWDIYVDFWDPRSVVQAGSVISQLPPPSPPSLAGVIACRHRSLNNDTTDTTSHNVVLTMTEYCPPWAPFFG